MHKDTLANIVIKAVRQANSVIDSSYEFPEADIRTKDEMAFRDNVLKYCNACHDDSKKEERAAYMQNILGYAASLQANEEYGKRLPAVIKSINTCKISTRIGIGACYAGGIAGYFLPSFSVMLVSLLGLLQSGTNNGYDRRGGQFHGKPLEKKLVDEHYEYSLQEGTAKELIQVSPQEFNEAMFEHWGDLMVAFEDIEHK
ncbi:MAG TPA: hypothetical protein HA362_00210 [Nanoarchaeota archaeon]|nr:hypothetical protein [Nanoarchaeota archaeon]